MNEQTRLDEEVTLFNANAAVLEQLINQLVKDGQNACDLKIEIKLQEGNINPLTGNETHKIQIVAKRTFNKFSKAILDVRQPKPDYGSRKGRGQPRVANK